VIKGIRLAVTDVLAPEGDWSSVLQRINALLRPGAAPAPADLTPEELAEVEAILSKVDEETAEAASGEGAPAQTEALRQELQRLACERDDYKKTAERLAQEKTALEADLKARMSQHGDLAQLEAELASLRSEREVIAAAQAAVDEKARALAAAREELGRERAALATERAQGLSEEDAARLKSAEELARERALLEDLRLDLRAEDVRLREEAAQIRQGQAALESDRQRLKDDMDLLREQEANLCAYEQRLRALSAEAEAERVNRAAPRLSREPFARDPSLEEAWNKVSRALDLLEAERRNFTDEKLVMKEEKARMETWEARLKETEAKLAEREQGLAAKANRPSFSSQPFKAAKAMLVGNKEP
jgi:hypothetical protein